MLGTVSGAVTAQEVGYLDLRGVQPRTHLRYQEPEVTCSGLTCSSQGSSVSVSLSCGAGRRDEPRALKATILSLDRTSYIEGDESEVEIKIENIGKVAMTLPWSPHLADLQSSDITLPLNYLSSWIQVSLAGEGDKEPQLLQLANLYGTADVPNSLVALQPGEWLRLIAMLPLKIQEAKGNRIDWVANVTFGLREVEFIPNTKESGYAENISNEYPKITSGPEISLQIFRKDDQLEAQKVTTEQP